MSKQNNAIFGLIAQTDDTVMQKAMLGNVASIRSVTPEEVEKLFEEFVQANAEKTAKAKRKVALERLGKEAEGINLKSEGLSDFIARVVKAKGSVTLNPDLSLSVSLPKTGSRGGGRVANDHPQPFVDIDGNRVFGPLTFWLDSAYSEAEQKEIEGVFRPNGKRRTGKSLSEALVKAGVLTSSPVPTEA